MNEVERAPRPGLADLAVCRSPVDHFSLEDLVWRASRVLSPDNLR